MATAGPTIYHPTPGETTSEDEKEDRTLVEADAEHARAAHAQTKFTWVNTMLHVFGIGCMHDKTILLCLIFPVPKYTALFSYILQTKLCTCFSVCLHGYLVWCVVCLIRLRAGVSGRGERERERERERRNGTWICRHIYMYVVCNLSSVHLTYEWTAGISLSPLSFVTGVIVREKLGVFERVLWRACRGNVFLRMAEIETPLENPTTVISTCDPPWENPKYCAEGLVIWDTG